MNIVDLRAYPTSFPVPAEASVTLGIGRADVSKVNLFRDELGSRPYTVAADGTVRPLEAPGLGLEIDEKFLERHPVIEGPGYV